MKSLEKLGKLQESYEKELELAKKHKQRADELKLKIEEVQMGGYDIDTAEGFEKSLSDIFDKIYTNIEQYSDQNFNAVFSEHPDEEIKMFSSYIPADDPAVLPLDVHYETLKENGIERNFKMFDEEGSGIFNIIDYDINYDEIPTIEVEEPQYDRTLEDAYEEYIHEMSDLMSEYRPQMGQEYDAMLRQVESMSKQLDAALKELQEVKSQIAGVRDVRTQWYGSHAAALVENGLNQAHDQLSQAKLRIVQDARETVKDFKQSGVRALDKAVLKLDIKNFLEAALGKLEHSAASMDRFIKKIETIGGELRSVGGHMKNIAHTMSGKEQQTVDGGSEGRFQAAILAPMRSVQKMIGQLRNTTIAAIGCVERLEQAAGRGRDPESTPKKEEAKIPIASRGRQAGKREEQPSVLKALQEAKEAAAGHGKQTDEQSREAGQHRPRIQDGAVL